MRIQTNLAAYSAQGRLSVNNNKKSKSIEKLSGGLRINRAADDAAGVAISEKMRNQIRGMNRASANVQDGVSLLDVADGALQKCHDIVGRMRELAVQSGSDTNDNELDRNALDLEYQELKKELNDIAENTNFNGIKLLDGSISKLTLIGVDLDVSGLSTDSANQKDKGTIVYGTNTITTSKQSQLTASNYPPSTVASVAMPDVSSATAGNTANNGATLASLVNLADEGSSTLANQQGRISGTDGISKIEGTGNVNVTNNNYTGYVSNTDTNGVLDVGANSGFVNSSAKTTTISSNDHTGQILVNNNAGASVTIGTNTGGEIQIGTVDEFTLTNNNNQTGVKDRGNSTTADYTYTYTYNHTNGTKSTPSVGQTQDRVDTHLNPWYDGSSGFNDTFDKNLGWTVYGNTYTRTVPSTGTYAGKPYDSITYTFVFNSPTAYNEDKRAESAYNYAYNTYWDESQTGKVTSDAVKNTVTNNYGTLEFSNTSANSNTNVQSNYSTLYTDNRSVNVDYNSSSVFSTNSAAGTVFNANSNSGNMYLWNETSTVSSNNYMILAHDTVKTLNVTNNNYVGYDYPPTVVNSEVDGQHTDTYRSNLGITSFAEKTIIGTNNGSALIRAGTIEVNMNAANGYIEVEAGAAVENIATNNGTVVLKAGADVSAWVAKGITNNGNIEMHGAVTGLTINKNNNNKSIIVKDGSEVTINDNAGNVTISGKRVDGGTESKATIVDNNGGTIRNGGTLVLEGDSVGTVVNYGVVDTTNLTDSTPPIYHMATDLDLTNIEFPSGIDFSSGDLNIIEAQLADPAHEYKISFTANGQTIEMTANWQLKPDYKNNATCACDPSVSVCQPNKFEVNLEAFELVFDLSTLSNAPPFEHGNVYISEDEKMNDENYLRYQLLDKVTIPGENGDVGSKLVFNATMTGTQTAKFENNDGLIIQSGANYGEETAIYIEKFTTNDPNEYGCLGCPCGTLSPTNIKKLETAVNAIGICSTTTDRISEVRAGIGALRNRLEYKEKNLNLASEYLQSAESIVRDADMAKEVTVLTRQDILAQGSTAMLAQANSLPQTVLQLFG